jgi:hypothetical protein
VRGDGISSELSDMEIFSTGEFRSEQRLPAHSINTHTHEQYRDLEAYGYFK